MNMRAAPDDVKKQAEKEVKLLSQLNHANIVKYRESFEGLYRSERLLQGYSIMIYLWLAVIEDLVKILILKKKQRQNIETQRLSDSFWNVRNTSKKKQNEQQYNVAKGVFNYLEPLIHVVRVEKLETSDIKQSLEWPLFRFQII